MIKEVIVLPMGGMKKLKEKLRSMGVSVSEPTILRALRDLKPMNRNRELYETIRELAVEMGGAIRVDEN